MADVKLTDEEIIKALKCHIEAEDCESCEMFGNCDEIVLTERVLNLINRQKAEIEKIKSNYSKLCEYAEKKELELAEINADISWFREAKISRLAPAIKEIKAKAYKEFAQQIKQEIKEAYDNNAEVLKEHFEKHKGDFNDAFVEMVEGKINTLLGLSDFIDNLLKEMVGEDE